MLDVTPTHLPRRALLISLHALPTYYSKNTRQRSSKEPLSITSISTRTFPSLRGGLPFASWLELKPSTSGALASLAEVQA